MGSYVMPTSDQTLFALWEAEPATVNITFNKNNDAASGSMQQQEITQGETAPLSANAFAYAGYDFTSWNTERDGSGISYADGAQLFAVKNLTLYAQWSTSTHDIGFRVEGSNLPEGITRRTGEKFGALPNPKSLMEAGEYVKSWNVQSSDGTMLKEDVTSSDTIEAGYPAKITLVANTATLPSRTVRFYCNLDDKQVASSQTFVFEAGVFEGGKVRIADDDPKDGAIDDDEAIVRYTAPTREGYSFIGWASKPDATGISDIYLSDDDIIWYDMLSADDTELFAIWARSDYYEVDYNGNGGTSPKGGKIVRYASGEGDVLSIAANPFTRSGYVFAGWNTKANGTGKAVSTSASRKTTDLGLIAHDALIAKLESAESQEEYEAALNEGKLTLYAQWTPVVQSAKPTLTTALSTSKKTAALSWGKVANAAKYTVSWCLSGAKSWKSAITTTRKYTVKGLKSGKCYQFRVRAANSVSTGSWSKVAYCYLKKTTKVKAATGKKRITVTWKRTPGATGYRIMYSTSKKMTGAKTVKVGSGKTTKRVIKGLKAKKRYYVRVIPVKKASGKTYIGVMSARTSAKTK